MSNFSTTYDGDGERFDPNDKVTNEEIEQLDNLLEDEKSHLRQWRKHMLAIFVISVSLLVNMVRGSKRTPSIIEIEKCG